MIIEITIRAFFKGQDDMVALPKSTALFEVDDKGDASPFDLNEPLQQCRDMTKPLMVVPMSSEEVEEVLAKETADDKFVDVMRHIIDPDEPS